MIFLKVFFCLLKSLFPYLIAYKFVHSNSIKEGTLSSLSVLTPAAAQHDTASHSLLPGGMGDRIRKIKVWESMGWDKGSLQGREKLFTWGKQNNESIHYFPSQQKANYA